jgi:beta-glucosidase/6-phospho-beta-glucosidase/beta-galactosidase
VKVHSLRESRERYQAVLLEAKVCYSGHKSLTEPYTAGHNLLLAHAHATKLYRDNYKASSGGQIGITLNGDFAIPYSDSDESELNISAVRASS